MAVHGPDGVVLPFTQVITEADVAAGRIRIPSAGDVKQLLPAERCRIDLTINGTRIDAAWDPRIGADKERSGVVSVPRAALGALVRPGEVLRVYQRAERRFIGERGSKLRLQQWVTRHRDALNASLRNSSATLDDFLEGIRSGSRRSDIPSGPPRRHPSPTPSSRVTSGPLSDSRTLPRTRRSGQTWDRTGTESQLSTDQTVSVAFSSLKPRAISPNPNPPAPRSRRAVETASFLHSRRQSATSGRRSRRTGSAAITSSRTD
jgi:hypothetical protein